MTISYIAERPTFAGETQKPRVAEAADLNATATTTTTTTTTNDTFTAGNANGDGRPILHYMLPQVLLLSSNSLQFPASAGDLKGDLYVTDQLLYWYSEPLKRGISIDYPSIGIHAIARTADSYSPGPCVYCQLDGEQFSSEGERRGEEEEDAFDPVMEVRFVPEDSEAVDPLFQALSHCASLHPDPDFEDGQDNDNEGTYDTDAPMIFYDRGEENAFANGDPYAAQIQPRSGAVHDANGTMEDEIESDEVELTPEGRATMERLQAMLLKSQEKEEEERQMR